MGNQLSTKGVNKHKKRKRKVRRSKKLQEKNINYIYESELEIEHFCGSEEESLENYKRDTNSSNAEWPELEDSKRDANGSKVDGHELEDYKRRTNCNKADWHKSYITFKNLALDNLPGPIQHQAVYDYIQARGNLVVHIIVSETSPDREPKQNGGHKASGYACICVGEIEEADCPLPDCKIIGGRHKVYGGILVTTNRHVILDEFECQHSQFFFFYDDGKSSDCKVKGHGHSLRDDSCENKDYVGVKIFLHDASAVERIRQFSSQAIEAWERIPRNIQTEFEKHTVVISHPHFWPKQVSFGLLLAKEELMDEDEDNDNSNNNNTPGSGGADGDKGGQGDNKNSVKKKFISGRRVSKYTSTTCMGSSGSPVLTGFYWNNPFIHSTGKKRSIKNEDGSISKAEIWGESYFF